LGLNNKLSFFSPPLSFFDFFFVFAPVDTQDIVSKTIGKEAASEKKKRIK
jgi:hypothetical protein